MDELEGFPSQKLVATVRIYHAFGRQGIPTAACGACTRENDIFHSEASDAEESSLNER